MTILITNDDGYHAKGINEIAQALSIFADVIIVAPSGPRSAQSSALTIETPIWVEKLASYGNVKRYSVSGTPADCVKIALSQLLDKKPDLIVSGINHGSNASINVLYSGTMGAAIEGALHDIPSIGLSLCSHSATADFSYCLPYFRHIVELVAKSGLPSNICLNVNAPVGEIKGIKVCRQAHGRWGNDFTPDNAPRDKAYYWMVGDFTSDDDNVQGTDQCALNEGYIAVVPVKYDYTDYSAIDSLKSIME